MNKKSEFYITNDVLLSHMFLKLAKSIISDIRYDHDDTIYLEQLIKLNNKTNKLGNIDCDSVYSIIRDALYGELIETKEKFYELFYKIYPSQPREYFSLENFEDLQNTYKEKSRNATEIMMYILANQCFDNFSYVLASILYNNIIYQNEKRIIVFHPNHKEKAISIATNGSVSEFAKFIEEITLQNQDYYAIKKPYSLEDVRELIKKIDYNLIEFLKVKKIYLFGSFARNTETIYSDLDFLIITDSQYFDNDLTRALLGTEFRKVFGDYFDINAIDAHEKINIFNLSILIDGIPILDNTLKLLGFN